MKRLSILLILTCIISVSQAQLRIALVAGGHQSDVIEENEVPGFEEFKKGYTKRTGAHFGVQADVPFSSTSNFSFQPGIIFTTRGRKFADSLTTTNGEVYQTRKQFINYIDFPLNLVYKIRLGKASKFVIGGGPVLSFFYNGKERSERFGDISFFESESNEDLPVGDAPGKYKVLNYGVNAVAGIEFRRVFITANYNRGLNDFYQAKDYTGSFKHQLIGGTLGIFIGKPVELAPKVKDKDKDGIPDEKDACPTEAGNELNNGCPDKDADGIADKDDQCPDKAGTVANKGCPILDRDNDGINDDKDKCPDVAGINKYEGCPVPDSDKDGINDEEDKCPNLAGLGRYNGCPIPDTDADGIDDEKDKCPTVKGISAKDGCPEEIKKEIVDKINYAARKIQFQVSKAELLPASLPVLDQVVALLKQNPGLKLSIEGHTSADGSRETNMRLSQARADKVKTYLVSKGIETNRLTAIGFGPDQPLNAGRTSVEKAQNRRVELKLSN